MLFEMSKLVKNEKKSEEGAQEKNKEIEKQKLKKQTEGDRKKRSLY